MSVLTNPCDETSRHILTPLSASDVWQHTYVGPITFVNTVSTICLIRVHHRSSLLNRGIYTVQGGVKKLSLSVVVKVLSLPELLAVIPVVLFALGDLTQYNS